MSYKDLSRGFQDRDPKVLAVINQKGGVGKSTTVINLAAALGETKKKVLIIDFDPQGNATSYDVILNETPIEEVLQQTVQKYVTIAPATIQLAGAEIELVSVDSRENILKRAIDQVKEYFDYILIDCPPSLGLLTINALVAANSILIPIQCEYYALEGVTKIVESMKMVQKQLNPDLEIFGVVMTMFDSRTSLSKQVVNEVSNYFGNKVFKTLIPRNVKIAEAPSHGLPVTMYARISMGALAYNKLAKEVNRRG